MYISLTLTVLPLIANFVSCESTKEPPKDIQQKTTFKSTVNKTLTTEETTKQAFKHEYLKAHQPISQSSTHPLNNQMWGENNARYKMLLRVPYSLTKLAKALSLGFDPSFNKEYFEPFERRPRPVTLVAFRKNGLASRRIVKYAESSSTEVAEMQSPYNVVSHFWDKDQAKI